MKSIVTEKRNGARPTDIAADQLKAIIHASFRSRPLLNKSEAQVFAALDRIVIARNAHWQVMAQVSLGEFLASEDEAAYRCINSKRVDFALMDASAQVHHAFEYQGSGHYQGSAAARDAVKKEALRKAGHRLPRDRRRPYDPCRVEAADREAGAKRRKRQDSVRRANPNKGDISP